MGHRRANYVRGFLLLCILQLSLCLNGWASTNQGKKKVTLNVEAVPWRRVFKSIEKQTSMTFFYSQDRLEKVLPERISITALDKTLDEVLSMIFQATAFTWTYSDNVITIKEMKHQGAGSVANIAIDSSITSMAVTGKVTAADGSPIPGATVLVKGTKDGVTTDSDGNFTLPNTKKNATLLISSIGFETREIPVSRKSLLVQLSLVVSKLDETVVIAYGTTTKRYSTGNVSTVRAKEIEKQPVSNPLLALQGRVPGLFITQGSGFAGTGVKVRIQGLNSLTKGNDPFYVIDGVPYTSQLLPNLGAILGTSGSDNGFNANNGNPLSFISPDNIESIEILKDADATAIYGSRAANGAILITTKKGKSGGTKIGANIQSGWGKVTRKVKLLDRRQYLDMRYEALKNDAIIPQPSDYDLTVWDTTRYTDWQKELIGGTAHYSNINLTISGGNSTTQYLVGGTYHRETSVFQDDFADQKSSVNFNINNTSPNQKFRIQLSGSYLIDNNQLPNNDITSDALRLSPVSPPLYLKDGSLNWAPDPNGTSTWDNPLSYLKNKYKNTTKNLLSNATLSYQIIPGLDIKSSFGYTSLQSDETILIPLTSMRPEDQPNGTRRGSYGNNNITTWIIEPQISIKKKISKGNLDALIGVTFQQNNSKGQQLYGFGFNSDQAIEDIRAASTVVVSSTLASIYKYNAIFGRINYTYLDRYIINLSARRDGSSRFGSANQFHNFGAIGLAWIFTNESFTQKKLPFLSYGKIKGSYGTTGNDQIGEYQFLNLYSPTYASAPYQGTTGLVPSSLFNPYLQWEETKKINLGIDLGFLNDKILFTSNYYYNRSSNQLVDYKLPIITGFSSTMQNFPATVQNTGWELSLQTTNLTVKNFSWLSSVNTTISRNKLLKFPNIANTPYANYLVLGQPVTLNRSYNFLGVDPTTGTYQFLDNNGKITTNPDPTKDKTVLNNNAATIYGGIQNTFKYKGLELDFLFQFVKQKGQNYTLGVYPGIRYNQPIQVLDRWQKPGDIASHQRFNSDFSLGEFFRFAEASNYAFTDASYIRLKNISLSWEMPQKWKSQLRLQDCRLYIQGQNLLTITNYIGLDPENPGLLSLPPLRIITVGIQATL